MLTYLIIYETFDGINDLSKYLSKTHPPLKYVNVINVDNGFCWFINKRFLFYKMKNANEVRWNSVKLRSLIYLIDNFTWTRILQNTWVKNYLNFISIIDLIIRKTPLYGNKKNTFWFLSKICHLKDKYTKSTIGNISLSKCAAISKTCFVFRKVQFECSFVEMPAYEL